MIWAIKNDAIGNVFFDKAAASFLLPSLDEAVPSSSQPQKSETIVFKRKKYVVAREDQQTDFGKMLFISTFHIY